MKTLLAILAFVACIGAVVAGVKLLLTAGALALAALMMLLTSAALLK